MSVLMQQHQAEVVSVLMSLLSDTLEPMKRKDVVLQYAAAVYLPALAAR